MQRLLSGVLKFKEHIFHEKKELFTRLAASQNPSALFLTCSDSRICPSLITQSGPGDLFVVRNAGNMVPVAVAGSGELASIEFAVKVLQVKDIIVCGHSSCGAMVGLLDQSVCQHSLPNLAAWLKHGEPAREFVMQSFPTSSRTEQIAKLTEANVLLQIERLTQIPAVRDALDQDQLDLHGWIYNIETGAITAYDLNSNSFIPIEEHLALHESGTIKSYQFGSHHASPVLT